MIDYKLELKDLAKKYNCENHLKIWIKRLNDIVKLGGEITDISDYHKLEYKFLMPKEVLTREKILLHLLESTSFVATVSYNKKKDMITVYYNDGD